MKKITMNDKPFSGEWDNLGEFLEGEGFNLNRIAVIKNGDILDRRKLRTIDIEDGDDLEVVTFVGGG